MALRWGILFSGQGAQKTGMALDCYENDSEFQKVVDASSQELQLDLIQIIRNEHGELKQTKNVQPALVAISLGFYAMLQHDLPQLNIQASVGLSLGEYSALIASGKLPFKIGMRILKARAMAMAMDSRSVKGKMVALIDPQEINQIEMICQKNCRADQIVQIANYNSPHQVVIGGNDSAVGCAIKEIENQRLVSKTVELKVDGAFHTPLYRHTQEVLQQEFADSEFIDNKKHVLSNTTGKDFQTDQIATILTKQVVSPTRFMDCLKTMITENHINATLEIGAGKTLSLFARQLDPTLDRERITNYRNYCRFIEKAREKEWI